MKKTLTLAIAFATMVTSCTKKIEVQTPPPVISAKLGLKQDPTFMNQTVQPPKVSHKAFRLLIDASLLDAAQLNGVQIDLPSTGDFLASRDVKNLYYTVNDGSTIMRQSEVRINPVDGINSFNQFATQVVNTKVYSIIGIYDVLTSATNGTGADDACTPRVKLIYSTKTVPRDSTGFIECQTTTFTIAPPLFSVASYPDSTNPVSATVIENQSVDVFHYGVGLFGQSGSITSHRFLVQGQGAAAVTTLKLFSGSTLVGQATVSNGVATITTNDALAAGTRKFYSVVPVVSVTSATSNYDFNIVLDEVKAVSAENEQKSDGTDRVGNNFTVFKTLLKIEKITISSTTINDSTEEDTYQLRITNIGTSTAYVTQISYSLIWTKNSSGPDTLQLKPRLICGNVQPAGLWADQNGDTSIGNGFFKDITSVMTFNFTTQQVISAGTSVVVTLKTFRKGFKNINDGFRIRPSFDVGSVDRSYKFINRGTIGFSKKLFSTSIQSASANPFKRKFIWGDGSDPANSPVPGISSEEWFDSSMFPALSDQVWVR